MRKIFYLFAILMCSISCTIDDSEKSPLENANPNDVLVQKIVAIWTDGTVEVIDFTYEGNRIKQIDDLNGLATSFSYDSNNLLTSIRKEVETGGYITTAFTYDEVNTLLYYIDFFNNTDNDPNTEDVAIRYDIQANTTEEAVLMVYSGNHRAQTEFVREEVISYNNGNRIKENTDVSYSYDSKNGLFKNIHALETLSLLDQGLLKGIHINTSINNTSSITEGSHGMEMKKGYDYSYNSINFPVKAVYEENGIKKADVEYFLDLKN